MKIYKLSYKDGVIVVDVTVDNNNIVGYVKIKHEHFEAKVGASLLDKLIKTDEAKSKRDIKLLVLHTIVKCTPFKFDKDHNEIADKSIIKFIKD